MLLRMAPLLFTILWGSTSFGQNSSQVIKIIQEKVELAKSDVQNRMPELLTLIQTVKFHEVSLPGGHRGLKVTGIPLQSILSQTGLEDQDTIVGVNDQKFENKAQGLALFDALRKAKDFVLKIDRKGVAKEIKVHVK